MNHRLISLGASLVLSLAGIAIGLGAMGVDVQGMLHLGDLQRVLQYGVGVCGLISLFLLTRTCFMDCKSCK